MQNSNSTTLTLQINQFDKITNKLFTTCSLIHKNILRDTKSAKKISTKNNDHHILTLSSAVVDLLQNICEKSNFENDI